MKEERDCAIVCAVLSLTIAVALIASNFPGNIAAVESARREYELHRKSLLEAQQEYYRCRDDLKKNQEALANVRRALN